MRIGFFTDTYFPQVSGVATSIRTLKNELEKQGHEVYIFTTTDPDADEFEKDIVRMPSVPFVSFKDRRIVVRGIWFAYQIAKELELEIIHTHTEFGSGFLGKMVANRLRIPVVHTYHTMYEDYLHYIANGKVLRPAHVKYFSKLFANHTTGVVCPSERVIEKLRSYGVYTPMRVIPTGIEIDKFRRPDITKEDTQKLRAQLNISPDQKMILSLSRISFEKNIQAIVQGFPDVLAARSDCRLVIVGKGPYREELEQMVETLGIRSFVQFTGEVANEEVAIYYKAADYFVSASTSETQGLTYTETLAAGTPSVVEGNAYLDNLLSDESLGVTFKKDQDFAAALLEYIERDIPFKKNIYEEKLYEISAEKFGLSMEKFYHDMMDYFEKYCLIKEENASIERIKIKLSSLKK